MASEFPVCQDCKAHSRAGVLVPLSDYGEGGAEVRYKVWVCTDSVCGFSVRVDKGAVSYGKKVHHGDR